MHSESLAGSIHTVHRLLGCTTIHRRTTIRTVEIWRRSTAAVAVVRRRPAKPDSLARLKLFFIHLSERKRNSEIVNCFGCRFILKILNSIDTNSWCSLTVIYARTILFFIITFILFNIINNSWIKYKYQWINSLCFY